MAWYDKFVEQERARVAGAVEPLAHEHRWLRIFRSVKEPIDVWDCGCGERQFVARGAPPGPHGDPLTPGAYAENALNDLMLHPPLILTTGRSA